MPEIFRYKRYRFFFFSNEGEPPEPMHVHVQKGSEAAKLWMNPYVHVASSYGIHPGMLQELVAAAEEHKDLIEKKWSEYVGN